eukprot:CAMPEP_0171099094 /NCGR_PEP_ID=MMETSP0766_2-20121228/50449_1 /TAXON_ID=439317 /ORGANISM="Gambierdiscus australes, Strain CAWD 149" /LENGTH=200 /DNA_ID=CAMNT_0011558621 /DNA_START=77 /DNA_END=679 /DNA_ORIENTATION=-
MALTTVLGLLLAGAASAHRGHQRSHAAVQLQVQPAANVTVGHADANVTAGQAKASHGGAAANTTASSKASRSGAAAAANTTASGKASHSGAAANTTASSKAAANTTAFAANNATAKQATPVLEEKMPLKAPEQGFHGKDVQHVNQKTSTGDWQKEFGPHGPQPPKEQEPEPEPEPKKKSAGTRAVAAVGVLGLCLSALAL